MVLLPNCGCCRSPCEACVDIYKSFSIQVNADNKCHPTAGPECTITIPSEYSLPVTVRLSGIVDDDLKFNGSIVEPGRYIYADNCNGGHYIGTANGGPGYVDETADDQSFTLKLVDNFGMVSWMSLKVCIDPENEQGVCIPPTTDCPIPPPPDVQCCKRIANCGGVYISTCATVPADVCCKSYANGDDTGCDGISPPYTSCETEGASPSFSPPYDCLNGSFQGGAWVKISGWDASIQEIIDDGSPIIGDALLANAFLESKINQTFFVPFDCLGAGQLALDLGPGETYPGGSECSGANLFLYIYVNLCARTAGVAIRHAGCYGVDDISIDLGALSPISVPCNYWTGCNCEGYSGSIPVGGISGGGTLTVSSS